MIKFKKVLNFKVVVSIVSILFLFTSLLYSQPISKDSLRPPTGEKRTYDRITEVIRDFKTQEKLIDPNLDSAHKEGRIKPFKAEHSEAINNVHRFLRTNGLEEAIPLFENLQQRAAVEVEGWDKGGLWLVEPKEGEALPLEHTSDRGGIHIADFPGADLERSYAHAIASYIGLPHWMAEPFENAYAEWRETSTPALSQDLKRNFLEMLKERYPLLLTHLSEKEKEGVFQRDYTLAEIDINLDRVRLEREAPTFFYIMHDGTELGFIEYGADQRNLFLKRVSVYKPYRGNDVGLQSLRLLRNMFPTHIFLGLEGGYLWHMVKVRGEDLGLVSYIRHGSPPAVFNLLSDGETRTRQQIAEHPDIKRSILTILPDLHFLVSAGLLIPKGRGEKATYVINPELSKNPALISRIQGILDEEFQYGKIVKTLRNQKERERIRERIFKEILSEVTYHDHINKHINPQAEALYQDFLKSKGIDVSLASNPENIAIFYNSLEKYQDSEIAIMEITGLYNNTRILEHIGLGRFYGRPIIYIDKSLKGKEREEILQHAYDEITKWDKERRTQGVEWGEMRDLILANYQEFQTIANRIHKQSHNINDILEKYGAEHYGNNLLIVIAEMPFKKEPRDVVIAAGNKPLENLKWPFEVPEIKTIVYGNSYFLESRYFKGDFYIGLTSEVIEDLDELNRIAEKKIEFETGAFGIGLVSDDYRFIVIERLILPRKVKFVKKFPDLPSYEQLEFMAGDADVLVEPNGVHYTTRYREYVQRQGRIVIEAHSHLSHTKTLTTKGRWPSQSDIQALRGDIIPAGCIIHSEGYTFYHASQNDEEMIEVKTLSQSPDDSSKFWNGFGGGGPGLSGINLPDGITLEEVTDEELEDLATWNPVLDWSDLSSPTWKPVFAWYRADIPFWTLMDYDNSYLLEGLLSYQDNPKPIKFASLNTEPPRIIIAYDESTKRFIVVDGMNRLGAHIIKHGIKENKILKCYLGIIKTDSSISGSPQAVFKLLSNSQTLTRQQIADALGRKVRTIQPDLHFLVSSGLLIQDGKGEKAFYVINPELSKNPALISRIQGILDEEFPYGKIVKTLRNQKERERIRERIFKEALEDGLHLAHVLEKYRPLRSTRDGV